MVGRDKSIRSSARSSALRATFEVYGSQLRVATRGHLQRSCGARERCSRRCRILVSGRKEARGAKRDGIFGFVTRSATPWAVPNIGSEPTQLELRSGSYLSLMLGATRTADPERRTTERSFDIDHRHHVSDLATVPTLTFDKAHLVSIRAGREGMLVDRSIKAQLILVIFHGSISASNAIT